MNLPNKLSLIRIFIVPIMGIFYILNYGWSIIVATALFLVAVFTDFLDGYIARKTNRVTDLGKLLDPIADKLLVCFALFLVVENGIFLQLDVIPLGVGGFCCAIIIGRELLIGLVRQIGATKSIVIQANYWGKIKAVFQYISIPILMVLGLKDLLIAISEVFYQVLFWIGFVTFAIATVLTVVSAIIYIVQNKKVFTFTK